MHTATDADRDTLRAALRVPYVHDFRHVYRGTADQLIAAGLLEQRHLPGLGSDRKMSATFYGDGLQSWLGLSFKQRGRMQQMTVRRLPGNKGRYEVSIYRTEKRAAAEEFDALMRRLRAPLREAH